MSQNQNVRTPPPPPAGPTVVTESRSASVTIGCKLPHGLIIEIGTPEDEGYVSVTLKGGNSSAIIGGYGLTRVSADVWAEWVRTHKFFPALRNGQLFVTPSEPDAQGEAVTRANVKTGFEGVDPENPPAEFGIQPDRDHLRMLQREVRRTEAL